MNQRNVDALTAIVRDIRNDWTDEEAGSWGSRDIAERLAAHGVLAPSALTDDEVDRMLQWGVHLYGDSQDGYSYDFEAEPLKLILQRIAKGEVWSEKDGWHSK